MKYCFDYYKTSKRINEIDELNIKYNKKDTTLLEFLNTYKNKRVNICINNLEDFIEDGSFENIIKIKNENPELSLYLRLPDYNEEIIEKIKETNIPFYLNIGAYCWDLAIGLIDLGVSDIFIVEDLCFDLRELSKYAHSKNVQIRTYPNVAQSAWKNIDWYKKFFIRPEGVPAYEQYIDVLEFYNSLDKGDTLYDIYVKDKYWFGPLKELILGFNSDLDSKFIIPEFDAYRANCQKRCKNNKCKICKNVGDVAGILKDKDIFFTPTQQQIDSAKDILAEKEED